MVEQKDKQHPHDVSSETRSFTSSDLPIENPGAKKSGVDRFLTSSAEDMQLRTLIGELREDFQETIELTAQKLSMQVQTTVARENQRIMDSVSNQLKTSTAMLKHTLQMQMQMQNELCELQKRMNVIEQANLKQQVNSLKKQPVPKSGRRRRMERTDPLEESESDLDVETKPACEGMDDDDLVEEPHRSDSDEDQYLESVFRRRRDKSSCKSSNQAYAAHSRGHVEEFGLDLARILASPLSPRVSPTANKVPANKSPASGLMARRSKRLGTWPKRSGPNAEKAPVVEPAIYRMGNQKVNKSPLSPARKPWRSALRYQTEPSWFQAPEDDKPEISCNVTNLRADRIAPAWHEPSPLHTRPIVMDPTSAVRATLNSQNLEVNTHSSDNPDSSDSNPQDPPSIENLFAAIERDDVETCHRLLSNTDFHEINQLNDKNLTILHKAALRGLPSVVSLILSHSKFTQANALMPGGLSALHCAAFHGFRQICDMLLWHPAFTIAHHKDDAGWSALDHAERFGGSAAGATAIALRRYGLRRDSDSE